ncbi:MAG: 2,3,4,5-tetrahydropyridine-2,6-dicarboxylate N-succinyltransferase [Actinomycetota bacterium]|nr:2,3,4,5-tetrahydropyridine-2,6-dicarboxylate N-succinyltransferase [Actinomycetota bacterium]
MTVSSDDLAATITKLWEAGVDFQSVLPLAQAHDAVRAAIGALDRGEARVAEVIDGEVVVHEWAKQAVLLWFRFQELEEIEVGPFEYVDRIPLKHDYREAGVRVVPGAQARFGSYLGRGVVLMPSYVNIGAYVDDDTMVDTWATVGSCAQIGKRVHLAGGVGIGGVLEPPQAKPVVIEDDVFIGSRCMIVGGSRVRRGAKLGAGVILTASIPVIDAQTGEEVSRGDIPERAVAVQASRPREFPGGTFGLSCVLVLRTLAEGEDHDDLQLNALLREHGIIS